MSRFEKRFWQMNDVQRAEARAIEAHRAPWRTAAVRALYRVTPRWFLQVFIAVMFVCLLGSNSSPVLSDLGTALLVIFFLFLGVGALLQGWSVLRGRILLTGIPNALLGAVSFGMGVAIVCSFFL